MIAPDLLPLAVPVDSLQPMPGNPRRGDVDAVARSLARFGQRKPIVVRTDGTIIAGNHTWKAALELGWEQIAVVRVADDDQEAFAFALADNRTGELGSFDQRALVELLDELDDLEGTGYTTDDVEDLQRIIDGLDEAGPGGDPEGEDDDGREPDTGELLALVDVSVGEPKHQVKHGQRWRLGEHLLVVAKVHDEHGLWAGDLPGRLFCPYPDPYYPLIDRARAHPCLFVQPNAYLAGHLLDKFASVFGSETVELEVVDSQ